MDDYFERGTECDVFQAVCESNQFHARRYRVESAPANTKGVGPLDFDIPNTLFEDGENGYDLSELVKCNAEQCEIIPEC